MARGLLRQTPELILEIGASLNGDCRVHDVLADLLASTGDDAILALPLLITKLADDRGWKVGLGM